MRITGQPGNSGRTGTVTGFDAGVFINEGSGNTIENLVVKDNIGPDGSEEPLLGDGIVLFHSGNNRLLKNVVRHNGPYDGIGVLGVDSNDNLIEGNTVEDTVGSAGFFVIDGVGIIINNFLDEEGTPRRGEPIRNNHLIDNVVRRSDNSGISNIGNVGARVVGNTVQDNGQRGEVCGDSGRLARCRPVGIPSNGIGFQAGPLAPRATEALIQGNTVSGNTGNGIEVNTEQNRIVGNTALGNGGSDGKHDLFDGNFDPPCDSNVWQDNVFGTANRLCVTGGLGSVEGPFGDPTCSDGVDNDLNGDIDEAQFSCRPPREGPR
ncbi:MAG TPA: right-handed parallel beta-helix repeat-containing protein [Acidimicrobiales bacterium]|nr:right-handed parallel beta-helix repeat-containing protein [Acidimicrobiales bacterium]